MIDFDAQSHKPLREIVYDQLKLEILEGKILPGTRMMEISLADRLGVSRTPVREAIRKLEKDGLVVIEPRRGAYASDVSISEMVDTMKVRAGLEALATAMAAERATEEGIEELTRICKANEKAVREDDIEGMISGDEDFHNCVIRLSNNKTLLQLSHIVQDLIVRFRYLYFRDSALYKVMPSDHKIILEAIRERDPEAAKSAAKEHVHKLEKFLLTDGKDKLKYRKR